MPGRASLGMVDPPPLLVYALPTTLGRCIPRTCPVHCPVCTPQDRSSTRTTRRDSRVVEREKSLRGGKRVFPPQEITILSQETRLFGQRNPTQRVVPHKELENVKTPPEVPSGPPSRL